MPSMFSLVLLVATGAVLVGDGANAFPFTGKSCSTKFRESLDDLMDVKKECGQAILRDCCEGAMLADTFQTTFKSCIYKIEDACSATDVKQFGLEKASMKARCDMETDGGGWLTIFRRDISTSPRVSFNRQWNEYEYGFGDLNTEFWYGLRNIHCLTTREDVDMRIELNATDGKYFVWKYGNFSVGGANTNYTLQVGQSSEIFNAGSLRDTMLANNGQQFTTTDRIHRVYRCPRDNSGGGWWWTPSTNCGRTYLTGFGSTNEMRWLGYPYGHYTIAQVEIKIRPKRCQMSKRSCGR